MPIQIGKQIGKVGKMYIECDTKDPENPKWYVQVYAFFEGGEKPIGNRIYITAKSRNIAHAKLKKLGFDDKAQSTQEIDDDPAICEGNEFEAVVTENGKYMNFDIVVEREKKSKQQIESLDALLRRAEPTDEKPPENDIPF